MTVGPSLTITLALHRGARLTPTWTTIHLVEAALAAGHRVWLLHPEDVEISRNSVLVARVRELRGTPPARALLTHRILRGELLRRHVELHRCDLLLLRLNPLPPAALAMALQVQERGVTVVNDPSGLALTRSKAWLAGLADIPRPRTMVTRSEASARLFVAELSAPVVVKPAMGSGGRGVTLLTDPRGRGLERALDEARAIGDGTVVLQEYLAEAEHGEKRLVWMDGEILGAYLRQRGGADFRHNLRQGGEPRPCAIDAVDREIGRRLRPHLERNGIRIAGLDIIGGKVIEVNTLNPGGVHHASNLRVDLPELADAEGTIADQMIRSLAMTSRDRQCRAEIKAKSTTTGQTTP